MTARVPIVDYLVIEADEPHLVAQRCEACGALFLDRRNACASCGKRSFGEQPLATSGVVRSFTIVHRAAPGVPTPYVSAVVDLDGGGSVKANIVETPPDPDHVRLAMPVRLVTFAVDTDDDGTEAVAFGFAPTDPPTDGRGADR